MTTYSLARMDRTVSLMSWFVLLVPIAMVAAAVLAGAVVLLPVAGFIAVVCLAVWLWFRPTGFELTPTVVRIVWPVRRAEFPVHDIDRVDRLTRAQFREEFGLGLRIGAGGLWGGFGLLWTTRGGTLRFYISRVDEFVLIRMKQGQDLMITPDDPQSFVGELRELVGAV